MQRRARRASALGQKLATALGLVPGLAVFERDKQRERLALEGLAGWAGRFTPNLSLAPPDELLLDIGGCLRLFGGLEAITSAIVAGCHEQGYTPQLGVAPTALGARWLARVGGGAVCADTDSPVGRTGGAALPGYPLAGRGAWPGWNPSACAILASLRALPGAGLRRRLGNGPVDDLSRAWGELPDPQKAFVFPEQFAPAWSCHLASSMPKR